MALVVVAFFMVLGLATSPPSSAQAKKPNILIIWGDDIGFWNVSAYNQDMGVPAQPESR
jgi:hypothetical protein